MEKFEFKSAICTTKEQSERLLALGLKKETADMCWQKLTLNGEVITYPAQDVWHCITTITDSHFPAWSLHRLLEMLYADIGECMIFFPNAYEEIIGDIENLIGRGTFNADYLEDKK
jgi:hypothetical protein